LGARLRPMLPGLIKALIRPHRFLDGESLGNTTLNASFALEDFFVPPELDLRFNHLGMFPDS
jgi:hypothetical protein